MHTPTRSLGCLALLLAVPASLVACGPTAMDPDPRLSHRQPIAEPATSVSASASASNTSSAPSVVEAPAPRVPWIGVVASRGASGVLAAWTESRIVVSRDDGRHYHNVLDSKEVVTKVTMDDSGTLFAVRGTRALGVVKKSGESTWRTIPFAKTTSALVAGAGVVAWIGERSDDSQGGEALAISRDDGASWTIATNAPPLGDFANELVINQDGTLRLMTSNEADCGGGWQASWNGDVATGAWKEATWPLDSPGRWGIGDDGWSYAVGDCGDGVEGKLCAIDPQGKASTIAALRASTFKSLHAVTNGRVTWATVDGKLAWLSRDAAIFPTAPPRGFALASVDADGQPIGIADGHAMRWSRDGKWRALFGH